MGIISIFTSGFDTVYIIILLCAWLLAITFSIVIHEYAHSFVAVKMGDDTPRLAGRLSLNPANHLDPLGFVCLVIIGFGWAKPVPINPNNFRNIRKGEILVSLAGITVNLICSVVFMFLYTLCFHLLDPTVIFYEFLIVLFQYLATINFVLAVFNLLPIYPLDGFNFLACFTRYDNRFMQFMRVYGQWILILLVLFGAVGGILNILYDLVLGNLFILFSLLF